MSRLAHRDARTLFERAWAHGVAAGIITPEHKEAIIKEGTRAMRKIASILGSENLRSDLERAQRAMMGLVNLHLEKTTRGDLRLASRALSEKGLLFHTRGASQAIKRILAIREGADPDHPDTEQLRRFEEEVVSAWPQYTYEEFQAQEDEAERMLDRRDAAEALLEMLSGNVRPDPHHEPEQVIMTTLLTLACLRKKAWPGTQKAFEDLLQAILKSPSRLGKLPKSIPEEYREVIEAVWDERIGAIRAVLTNPDQALHQLVAGDPAANPLHPLLVVPDVGLGDLDDLEAQTTSHWAKLTRGSTDESRLLLIMLQGTLGMTEKAPFSQKTALHLLDSVLASRPADRQIREWLEANAPHPLQSGLIRLWTDFWEDRELSLHEDSDTEDRIRFAREWLPMKASSRKA